MAWTVADRSRRPMSSGPFTGAEVIVFAELVEDDPTKVFDFTTDVVGAAPNASHGELLSVYMEYTSAAGGSAREPTCDIRDSADDVVGGFGAGNTIAGGASRQLMFGQNLLTSAAPEPDQEPLPSDIVLFPGMDLNFTAANSAATDHMLIWIHMAVYS